jgi:hypothetical protein
MNQIELLQDIAARSDNEHVAVLSAAEQDFAMTLAGRRLLECVKIGRSEFRLSPTARKLLAESSTPAGRSPS